MEFCLYNEIILVVTVKNNTQIPQMSVHKTLKLNNVCSYKGQVLLCRN